MGMKTGLVIGFGIGYVLGAKAGRERYLEITSAWSNFTHDPRVQDLTAKGKAVVDLSTERARAAMSERLTGASKKIRDAASGNGQAASPPS